MSRGRRIDYHFTMSDLNKPPYPGQGEPIPANLGKGTWIVRDMAILFDDSGMGAPTSEMRAALPPTGASMNPVLAFNAPGIASLMQLPVEIVIRANKNRTLQIENQLLRSTTDGIHTMRFVFVIEGKTSAFTADIVATPTA